MSIEMLPLYNGNAAPLKTLPSLTTDDFREAIIRRVGEGSRIAALFGMTLDANTVRLIAVLADDAGGLLYLASTQVAQSCPALTPECPQAHLFEREIAEQFGIRPEGHPWLKPVRYHHSYTGRDAWGRACCESILPGVADFFRVEGSEIHEVAVGPVHAGVIEPGHFRFQCSGEDVLHLEIALGYQHRGIEPCLIGAPDNRTIRLIETVAGDTTIGHTTAYCQLIESLSRTPVPARAQALRGIALELERLACHTGDLGALAGDIGYLPTSSFCGRIRGDFLNMTALLCGNRFGRGLVCPGGAAFDLKPRHIDDLRKRLADAFKDVSGAADCLLTTPSVLSRFDDAGRLSRQTARDLGLVGPPARACGLESDARYNFPSGIFRFRQIPVATWDTGDVFARAYVRWLEIRHSVAFIREQLDAMPAGPVQTSRAVAPALTPDSIAVSLTEGWRGEICHVAVTNVDGRFARYKIVDPSFHNWTGLAAAMRNQPVSDFPLCNKSFNLSYCGHDL